MAQLSVEDPCNQKLFPAIISELLRKKGQRGMPYQVTGQASCKGEQYLAPVLV